MSIQPAPSKRKAALPAGGDLCLDRQLGLLLNQCANRVAKIYGHRLEPHGLTFSQYLALLALWEIGPTTVGKICKALKLETSTLTPVLKRLEVLGFVRRFRDRLDERLVHVALTDRGSAFKAEAGQIRVQLLKDLGASAMDVDDLISRLRMLDLALDKIDNRTTA